eukprot:4123049-Amphidinium_carterae.1
MLRNLRCNPILCVTSIALDEVIALLVLASKFRSLFFCSVAGHRPPHRISLQASRGDQDSPKHPPKSVKNELPSHRF